MDKFIVKIPVEPQDKERFLKWCKHYGYFTKSKKSDPYIEVTGTDPLNLFWLGANMMANIPTTGLSKPRF